MNKFILLSILLPLALGVCSHRCQTCLGNDSEPNPYNCESCYPDNSSPFISSCNAPSKDFNKLLGPAVIITLLHLFMLAMGMGMYH